MSFINEMGSNFLVDVLLHGSYLQSIAPIGSHIVILNTWKLAILINLHATTWISHANSTAFRLESPGAFHTTGLSCMVQRAVNGWHSLCRFGLIDVQWMVSYIETLWPAKSNKGPQSTILRTSEGKAATMGVYKMLLKGCEHLQVCCKSSVL
jgi:hypothetical protein